MKIRKQSQQIVRFNFILKITMYLLILSHKFFQCKCARKYSHKAVGYILVSYATVTSVVIYFLLVDGAILKIIQQLLPAFICRPVFGMMDKQKRYVQQISLLFFTVTK